MLDVTPDATQFEIADRLALVKRKEQEWRERRVRLESRLVEALRFSKPKGSRTYTLRDNLSTASFKVVVDQPVYESIDEAAWADVSREIPEDLQPVRVKHEPVAKLVAALRDEHPDLFLKFCRAYSTRPGKVGVSFK